MMQEEKQTAEHMILYHRYVWIKHFFCVSVGVNCNQCKIDGCCLPNLLVKSPEVPVVHRTYVSMKKQLLLAHAEPVYLDPILRAWAAQMHFLHVPQKAFAFDRLLWL